MQDKSNKTETKKRVKRTKRVSGGSLHMDVMLRVATFLHPKDLFALSFTNKLNYQLVASHSLIWHRARLAHMPARVLPPPIGMTEKEYAWFLTTNRCLKCHRVKPLEIDWNLRAKCCSDCLGPLREEEEEKSFDSRSRNRESNIDDSQLQVSNLSSLTLKERGWCVNTSARRDHLEL
jgi:hypothetical protein